MDIQILKQNLIKYNELLKDINSICDFLKNSKSPLSEASKDIKKHYLINERAADNGRILSNYELIKDVIYSLESVIKPEIESNVRKLSEQINDLEIKNLLIM